MNRQDLFQLADLLGLKQVSASTSWLKASCPFSFKTHKDGVDYHPSFGIRIDTQSFYHCFSCSQSGYLFSLPTTLSFMAGKDLPEVREFIFNHENSEPPPYEEVPAKKVLRPISKVALKKFKPMHPGYRGITEASVQEWDLKYDVIENRMIFLIQDQHGRTVSVRGRALDSRSLKYRTYSELTKADDPKAAGVWYGMQFPLVENKLLALCESEIDAILLKQSGVSNVWASMGASISLNQTKALKNLSCPVLLLFDNDRAGELARDKTYAALKGLMPLYHISNYYSVKDVGEAHEKRLLNKLLASMCLFKPRKKNLDK